MRYTTYAGALVGGLLMMGSTCGDETTTATFRCDFGTNFASAAESDVELRYQDDLTDLCEVPSESIILDRGAGYTFEKREREEPLVWIRSGDRSEVWQLDFATMSCELAIPTYERDCSSSAPSDAGRD